MAAVSRRQVLVALAALTAPLPLVAEPLSRLSISVDLDPSALHTAVQVLGEAVERFPAVRDPLRELLFDGGETLREGLIELRNVPASRAGHLTIALDFSERFREIVAAARAGEVHRLRSYRRIQFVHGGTYGK